MRFIVLVKATEKSEAGVLPTAEQLAEMRAFNAELAQAGTILAADGLTPTSQGTRVTYNGGKPTVIDGPFTETKELVAGFWILQMKSKEEAVEWLRRAPFDDAQVEIRRIYDLEDFAEVAK